MAKTGIKTQLFMALVVPLLQKALEPIGDSLRGLVSRKVSRQEVIEQSSRLPCSCQHLRGQHQRLQYSHYRPQRTLQAKDPDWYEEDEETKVWKKQWLAVKKQVVTGLREEFMVHKSLSETCQRALAEFLCQEKVPDGIWASGNARDDVINTLEACGNIIMWIRNHEWIQVEHELGRMFNQVPQTSGLVAQALAAAPRDAQLSQSSPPLKNRKLLTYRRSLPVLRNPDDQISLSSDESSDFSEECSGSDSNNEDSESRQLAARRDFRHSGQTGKTHDRLLISAAKISNSRNKNRAGKKLAGKHPSSPTRKPRRRLSFVTDSDSSDEKKIPKKAIPIDATPNKRQLTSQKGSEHGHPVSLGNSTSSNQVVLRPQSAPQHISGSFSSNQYVPYQQELSRPTNNQTMPPLIAPLSLPAAQHPPLHQRTVLAPLDPLSPRNKTYRMG